MGDIEHDLLIVGSGAGGGTLAYALARAGWNVLLLEKGPRHALTDYIHDEIRLATQPDLFIPSIDDDPHVIVEEAKGGAPRLTTIGWISSCVGGGTVHMGASLYRFHPDDFRARQRYGSFEAVEDWPYGYDDLEPYYARAEHLVGVSGDSTPLPFGGARSCGYPMPPLPDHVLADDLMRACRSLGLHPIRTPRGINSREYDGRPACAGCQVCAGRGCPTGAKGSIQMTLLRRAEETGRCEVRTHATARAITVDARGRATGCLYLDADGREHRVRARLVSISASAVESARLLLLSKSPAWPDGLANGSGLVGRNLQFHIASGGYGRFTRAGGLAAHPARTFASVSVLDYYALPPDVSTFAKGAALGFDRPHASTVAAARSIAREGPHGLTWGTPLKRRLIEHFTNTLELEFETYQDFIPNDRTHVTLDDDVTDRHGLAVARMHVGDVPHHRIAGEWLRERGLEILDAMGASEIRPRAAGALNHVMVQGTCRAGRDPTRSVLNEFCQSHEVPNLFVVDGSFMPTCGGAPTTLTIIANSLRTADYILDSARTGLTARLN